MNALVLQGGGVKGAFQIGAYYALKHCRVKIHGFYGTSIGSFNAAMLCAGKDEELLNFWKNVDPGELFGFEKSMVDGINQEVFDKNFVVGTLTTLKNILFNRGINIDPLLNQIDKLLEEDEVLKSSYDYGLFTVKLKGFTAMPVYKSDIPKGKLKEYIMASCYMPVFKTKKLIDDSIYIDGGFIDSCPVNMAIDKNYDNIYAIRINGIGLDQKIKESNANIITINPSRPNGSVLELKHSLIIDNIKMGYYDTLRVLKGYDGFKYCFKKVPLFYLKWLVRKVPSRELKRICNFFNTDDIRDVIIHSLEYIMEKESIDYYKVYRVSSILRKLRKLKKEHFIYDFVRKLRIL